MNRAIPSTGLATLLLLAACGGDGANGAAPSTAPASSSPAPTTAGAPSCPSDAFQTALDGQAQPGGYGTVELSVSCAGDTMTVRSNGMIAYEFVQITPNDLAAVEQTFDIPLDPVAADAPGAVGLGPIGVAVNGVPFFAAFEAPQQGYGDPLSDGLLDFCDGHTAPGGMYHYHAMPTCVVDAGTEGVVVGYANDGYEIVTPIDGGQAVTSSYVKVDEASNAAFDAWEYQAGTGDLDECNGMTGSDGVYRYYLTDAFPYLPFCYHGVTDASVGDFDGTPPTQAGR